MTQILSKPYKNLLSALILLAAVFACMNAKAETVWSTGGTYADTTSITDGLTITSADAVDITGKYTVSGVLNGDNPNSPDAASIRLYGAGTVTVKSGGELSIVAATGTKSGLVAYPGAHLTVESGATMNITTNGERIRFSHGTTTYNDSKTIVNWAGNGTWNLGGGETFFFSLTTPGDSSTATFNITGGSLNIKNGKISMAFGSTTNWNITGGTLTVGEGDLVLNFGGGTHNASPTTVGNITVNGGTFNVRGSGEWKWGQLYDSNPSNLTLDLTIQSGKFSTSRSITQDTGITTRKETITLAGGTFEAVKPGTNAVTLDVAAGIATKLTASSTFNVGDGVTLNYNSPITRTAGDLTKTGNGTLTLGGANTLTGGTVTISAGAVAVSAANQLDGAAITLKGGTLTATNDLTLSNDIDVTDHSLISVDANKTLTLTGQLTATNGKNINKTGDGTLVLSNSSTSLAGTILNINSGKLKITENMSLKAIGANTTGATLEIATGKTVDLNEGINNWQTGKIHKTGEGTLIIAPGEGKGALPLEFYLDEGTLVLNRGATMTAAKTLYMADGTTFRFQGTNATASPVEVTGTATLDIPSGKTMAHSGAFTGGTLNKTSAGTLKLTGAADNTTNFNVQAGTLELAATGAAANNLTVGDGATLNVSARNQDVTSLLTLNSGSVMNLNVTGTDAYSSLTAKTLDIKDGSKIEVKFSDSVDPFAIGTLELITADQFKVNGTMVSSDDAMKVLLENYVEVTADWAQLSYIPHGTTGYTVLLQTNFNAIPEPSTWLLALLGFAGLGVLRRRRFPSV